ncbi:ROK family transcriptional regulator [Microbacterium sp. VKM Ac-2870]|uniref:ROK family transcriptional regulator n=1 Tax=Microbacterium sp. VKM Ac-2870 TaxID=2783825 RepID=UPI00188C0540|nr:ROK family transcriptional regulator [Microbacterium sp. VKM Ac-2870]MBF4562237.1 ROK family transcriptional regulator [Microbacterium sp. VKM Ac-2870]
MLSTRGSNLLGVGNYNQALILDLIRRAPEGMSRVELAEKTGLSPQTLTNVTRRLTAEGFIAEAGKVSSGPGKPRTMLALDPSARYALGVHLDPAVTTVVLLDLAGRIIHHREISPTGASSTQQLAEIGAVASELTASLDDPTRLLGVGIAAPGPLDISSGQLLNPPLLPEWSGTRLRDELAALTGLPALLEKDVIAAMVGELWVTPSGELGDALFFYYGAGAGVGLSLANTPLRGATSNAGDIAHLIVDPDGPPCECGARGCLGVSLEPATLLADAGWDAGPAQAPRDPRAALDELCLRAREGEPLPVETLTRAARRIARALVQLDNLLDLTDAVLGGPIWARLSPFLRPALGEALAQTGGVTTTQPLTLRESRLGTDVAAVGAACLVLDGAFTARPSHLLITD